MFNTCIVPGCHEEDLSDLDQTTGLCGGCARSGAPALAGEVQRLTAQVEAERAERDEAERLQRVDEGTLTYVHEILAPLFPAPGYREPRPTTADLALLLVERLQAQEQALGGVLAEVAAERARQVAKGYTAEHDDGAERGELAQVAALILLDADDGLPTTAHNADKVAVHIMERHDRRQQLIIALALGLAEVERQDRLRARKPSTPAPAQEQAP